MLQAVPVHLGGGLWGMVAAGLFTCPRAYADAYGHHRARHCAGLLYGGGGAQLGANLIFLVRVRVRVRVR